jgi:magnesium-transporting ATPase (P-type)
VSARDQIQASEAPAPNAWHALPAEECLAQLGSGPEGLPQSEVSERLRRFGANALPAPAGRSALRRFLGQFESGLIYFLLAASAASFLLGHIVDASVICLVVLVNAVVGFVQEGRAEQALDAIGRLVSREATVIRDGQRRRVPAPDLVPGDVLLLEPGAKIPADARLIRARALSVDEALLTGESVNAEKGVAPAPADAALADRASMVFSGTIVAMGQARAVVTATGAETEIGRISGMVQQVEPFSTPLLRQIDSFAARFTKLILAASALLFAFLIVLRGFEWSAALMMVVALAVGVIPEGLPAVITITLAIGVRRMAARKAVIRKLPAVETLGAVSVICTDKTGTLTRNEMMVRRVILGGCEVEVGGAGYEPSGELSFVRGEGDAASAVLPLARCGLLCGDARLDERPDGWSAEGDPMEGALIALAIKAGLDPARERREWQRLDELPFDAAHRYMATLHRGPDGGRVVFVKGAPEALLRMMGPAAPTVDWEADANAAAEKGERVLGFATKRLDGAVEWLDAEHLSEGLEPLGLAGFIDPPREEARDAVAECRGAGIAVKMITGDHSATALAIARQLRIADAPEAMTGSELERLDEAQLRSAVARISVFARASPEHKLRIVKALQAEGHIVAMTGDGVNDAPSLKQADVGTAMGKKGTEASREAAEMVLLDDNFASIVAAVREGRTVYDNIRKVIAWTLPTNGGESVVVLLAILIGFTLPMTATQILWINLVTDSALGIALAFEPSEPGTMRRRPRQRDLPLLSGFLLWRTLLVSVLFAGLSLGVFFAALEAGSGIEKARTMVVDMLVVVGIFYLFNVRYRHGGSLSLRGILGTRALLISLAAVAAAQLAFTYLPFMNAVFESRPLSPLELASIVGLGLALMVVLEGEKFLARKLGWLDEPGRRGVGRPRSLP